MTYLFLSILASACVAFLRESYKFVLERRYVSLMLCFLHNFDQEVSLLNSMFRFLTPSSLVRFVTFMLTEFNVDYK